MKAKIIIKIIDHTTVYVQPHADENALPFRISAEIDRQNYTVKEWSYNRVHPHASEYTSSPLRYISQEELTAAEKQIYKGIATIKKNVKDGKKHPAYPEMKKVFDAQVKHYKDDFNFFDVARLGNGGIEFKFIWSVRECGTWLLSLMSKDDSQWADCITASQEPQNFYYWNGAALQWITREKARRLLELKSL